MLDARALAGLRELLRDAESCARLNQYEEDFLDGMRARVLIHAADTHVSDKQWTVLQRIEGKVYAT
jgi:hypothetical protein